MENKNEIRTINSKPYLRELTNEEGERIESRTIEGCAIVFNQKSELLDDWSGRYREIISPCISQEWLDSQDVKMTLWHNREKLIARHYPDGSGTLALEVREDGVYFSFEAPETPDGKTALELVKRGDLSGCSFTYIADESKTIYTDDEDGELLRTVNAFRWIGEMTIGSDPAYQQTSVNAREVAKNLPKNQQKEEEEKQIREMEEEYNQRRTFMLMNGIRY